MDERLVRAREAEDHRRWATVVSQLQAHDSAGGDSAGGGEGGLGPVDVERLARATWLVGRDQDGYDLWARAHRGRLDAGDTAGAVRDAFWLGLLLVQAGDAARGGGWLARAARLVEGLPEDSVEHGYLHLPGALRALHAGDGVMAMRGFEAAFRVGQHADEPDLATLGLLGMGQAGVLGDDVDAALGNLDEAMVAVVAGEVTPIIAGIVYCGVIAACHDTLDLRRAREWTRALGEWCESQPDLVPYRGQCLVHRAQVLQVAGQWTEALDEVVRAREAFVVADDQVAVGAAWYEEAEVHRLRGDVQRARRAYERAARAGHPSQPGLALLRLDEGDPAVAVQALETAVAAAERDVQRVRVLPALVEARLATGTVAAARTAADELAASARRLDVDWVRAASERALGAVCLAEDRPTTALSHLQASCRAWRHLRMPHEEARTRVLVARACRAVGDLDTARLELGAARRTATELGAGPLREAIDRLTDVDTRPAPGGLTAREVEVLAQVATGRTNREIAEVLFISDKTVGRHLSNIFTKLDLSSRAAATAWAYEHDVVGSSA